ncbi:MAG TPA: protein phosphatase 2C domain-containing protein [Aeromicrobium sp.]|nr:protein phosphatase 2C domain-containing protein [Aeromicrobium sp.]
MPDLTYRYVALSDTGLRRPANQDSGFASSRLLVLADGMGGAAAGDLASSEALHVVRKLDRPIEGDPVEALAGAVSRANDRLHELIAEDSAVEGMGTTLTALLFDGEKFAMAHIGDSRAYRLRDGQLTQISDDHTFVQSLVDEGRLTRAEARVHPHRSLILRALLGRDDNDPDLSTVELKVGDRYLLCSDGLSDMVTDSDIESTLGAETIDLASVKLVELALEGGGVDNVTVVICEIVDADTPEVEGLSSADGQPQLVGAAAEQDRPRTHQDTSSTTPVSGPPDPEELRYAPREPSRRRWIGWTLIVLLVLAGFGFGGKFAYDWTQDQYFVSEHNGKVTVFRGMQSDLPGLTLQHVDTITAIDVESLPPFSQSEVRDGIEATSKADANSTVDELRRLAGQPKTTQPETSPSDKPSAEPSDETATTVFGPKTDTR